MPRVGEVDVLLPMRIMDPRQFHCPGGVGGFRERGVEFPGVFVTKEKQEGDAKGQGVRSDLEVDIVSYDWGFSLRRPRKTILSLFLGVVSKERR